MLRTTLSLAAILLLTGGCAKQALDCVENDECSEEEGCNQLTFTCTDEVAGWRCPDDQECDDDSGRRVFCVFQDETKADAGDGFCIRECDDGCPEGFECKDAPEGLGVTELCLPQDTGCVHRWVHQGGDDYELEPFGDC